MKKIVLLISTIILTNVSTLNAQIGVSSSSLSLTRSNGLTSNYDLNANTIYVEDFINFHKHDIAIPTEKEVALSIDYNNKVLDDPNQFILQVGLATQEEGMRTISQKNANIALVIDCSGSMRGGRLDKVKEAAQEFIKGMRDTDYIAIVSFSDDASVELASVKVGENRNKIKNVIDSIQGTGSTNLNAGMILGYEEALKNNKSNFNSRVVLLTDGMTNTGERDPENIIKNSKNYNDKGIQISTIGVGNSLDYNLLRQISSEGKGSSHFIGDDKEDIRKVFINELESMLYSIGQNPEVTITLPDGYKIEELYGYKPKYENENKVTIYPENLTAGQTQVFIMRVNKAKNANSSKIKATLTYQKDEKEIGITKEKKYTTNDYTKKETKKNYQIAKAALAIKNTMLAYSNHNLNEVEKTITDIEHYLSSEADLHDKDIKRIYDIIKDIKDHFNIFEDTKYYY
jgi:Mg-chelatase subunit ChlD